MAAKNNNERAWTPQDVKALECAMLNKLEIGFTSIDNDEIPNPNIPWMPNLQTSGDAASKKVLKTVEVAADQASKNEVVTARMMEHQGHLTSAVYKQVHEENQKQLKLTEVSELLGNDSDRKVQAKNLSNKVSSVFKDNGLSLPSSTRIEIWGHDKKKNPFVVAQFSNTSEARTFENQAAQARKKGLLKMKTFRMDPKEDPAFPIPSCQLHKNTLKRVQEPELVN